LQMLVVTITGSHSHVDNQALDEVRHCLADVLLWQLSQMVCRAAFKFNSSVVLSFGWSLWCFPA